MTLVDVLADPGRLAAVARDGAALVEREVAAKTGVSGAAIRMGFRTLQKVKPGVVEEALRVLLPQFAPKVDPHFAAARASGEVSAWFVAHGDRIAEDLLSVTDARAARATNRVVVSAYRALRPQAHKQVVAAMPGLAELCERHVPQPGAGR